MSPSAEGSSEAGPPISRWEQFSFSIAHGAAAGFLRLLGLNGLYRFGRLFGTVEWLINFKRRGRFARTLRQVMGESAPPGRRALSRQHFMQTRCDKIFYLVFDRIERPLAMTRLTIGNQQMLDDALARGHGVYLALCHHGPLHVAAMLMALRGYKTAGVRDRREGAMRRYVQTLYDRRYPEFRRMRVLYADSFPREIYRCFEEGCVLGSAMDVGRLRDPRQRSHEVRLFGRSQLFLTGPLRVALRCKAPVLQAFVLPGRNFEYRLEISQWLLDPLDAGPEEEAVARAINAYAGNVERYIREYPSLITRA